MTAHRARVRTRIGALVATTALLLGGAVATGGTAQAAIAAPSGLRAVDVASKGVALAWNVTGEDAYRVRIATNSAMSSGVDTWDLIGNYYEWTRTDANPAKRAPRLTPGKTYYFQVKAVKKARFVKDRSNLSSYSKAIKVTLPKTALPELKPTNVKITRGGADAMHVSWSNRGPGMSYVLRYTSSPSLKVTKWKGVKFDTPTATIRKLVPGKKYYFRPRVIDAAGKAQSAYAAAGPSATHVATSSPDLSIATYNVRKMYSTTDWANRRTAVAANIKTAAPDVIGLQEATPVTWATNKKKQYADLMALLGSPYALATSGSGSSGTQLAYNTQRVTPLNSGIRRLSDHGSAARYAVWAIFKDKVSGKTFFAVTTHLEPGTSTSELNEVRKRQANDVLDVIKDNAGGRPTVILGDMNSSRSAEPENGQYKVFTGAGYVDPIDNVDASLLTGAGATAEHIIDSIYSSANKMQAKAPLSSYPRGTHIDYTFVSPGVRVASWRMVLKLDTNGAYVGAIPSDHNLIKMSVHLP